MKETKSRIHKETNRPLPSGIDEDAYVDQLLEEREGYDYPVDNSHWQGDCMEMGQ